MAFMTMDDKTLNQSEAGGGISTSGIYDVTIKHAEVSYTTNGAVQLNYHLDSAAGGLIVFGMGVSNTDGSDNFAKGTSMSLIPILGEDTLEDPEPATIKYKNKTEEKPCIPNLEGREVKAWIQFQYGLYNGTLQEKKVIKRFYQVGTNKSGTEIKEGLDATRFDKDTAKALDVIYKDGLDAETVASMKKSEANGKSGGGQSAPAAQKAPAANPFQ